MGDRGGSSTILITRDGPTPQIIRFVAVRSSVRRATLNR